MSIELRNRFREIYASASTPVETDTATASTAPEPGFEPERAFVMQAKSGRTVITGPLREIALANQGFTYLRGRFVEADTPNSNGALWTTEDLELGQNTVAGGPLNWLHDDRQIIGSLLDGHLVGGREEARKFSADQRKKMADKGTAKGDGSFPISNAEDLANAIRLAGNAKDPAAARRHIIRRAKALGLYDRIPDSWKKEKAELEVGNHIETTAAVWRFLFPKQTDAIEKAAADHGLYFSMECISREVACVDTPGRPGCGEQFGYADYDAGRTCAHLRERSAVRRFVDPIFLGGAVIVPPVRPGWANAEAEVVRQAAAATERASLDELSAQQATELAAAVLQWANR